MFKSGEPMETAEDDWRMPSVAISDNWPDFLTVDQAIKFAASHGVQVGPWQLRNGNSGWPRAHKVSEGQAVRWRKTELLARIELAKRSKGNG